MQISKLFLHETLSQVTSTRSIHTKIKASIPGMKTSVFIKIQTLPSIEQEHNITQPKVGKCPSSASPFSPFN